MALMQHRRDTQSPQIIGVILAGGRGLRMGGCEKGLLPFHGKTLLGHAIDRLAPQVDQLVINANRELDTYRAFGLEVIHDQEPMSNQGPMAGIDAAMSYIHRLYPKHDCWLLIAPCDSPLLPHDLVKRLLGAATELNLPAAVVWDGVRTHPTFNLLHTSLQSSLTSALTNGELKLGQWLQDIRAVRVDFSDQPDAFINFNTPEQLATERTIQSERSATGPMAP